MACPGLLSIQLLAAVLKYVFIGTKTDLSRGCVLCEVCGGKVIIQTWFSLAYSSDYSERWLS